MIEYTIKHLPLFEDIENVCLQCTAIDGEHYSQMQNILPKQQMHAQEYYFLITGMLHYVTKQIEIFKARK